MVVGAGIGIPLTRHRTSSPSRYRLFSTTTRLARQEGRQWGNSINTIHHSIFATWSLRVTCQFRKDDKWRKDSFRAATTGAATDSTSAGTRAVQASGGVLIKNAPVQKQQRLKGNAFSTDPVHEDPALKWARTNPRVAQACLHVPPMPTTLLADDRNGLTVSIFQDWLHYLQCRQWNDIFASLLSIDSTKLNDTMALHHARALVSHVLTGPLTLYTALVSSTKVTHLFSGSISNDSNNVDAVSSTTAAKTTDTTTTTAATTTTLRLCCIGARSEAMLPVEYWKELLDLLVLYRQRQQQQQQQQHGASLSSSSSSSSAALHLYIDFCGPEMNSQRPDTTLSSSLDDDSCTSSSSSHITLRWVYTGKFHDYYHQSNDGFCLPEYNVMVLFNPGVGHPYLQKDWKPTLDLLFPSNANSNDGSSSTHGTASHNSTDSPTAQPHLSSTLPNQQQLPLVILTAHSAEDAARDQAHLRRHYGSVCAGLEYVVNPFASHIRYQDPLQANHMVQPNYSVAVV